MSLDTDLVAAYNFDGAITDNAPGGLDYVGPIVGYATGKIGQALATDGTQDTTPQRTAFVTSGSFTVETWVYGEGSGSGVVWSQIGSTGVVAFPGMQSISVFSFDTGTVVGAVSNSPAVFAVIGSMVGKWTHLILVYNHATTTLKLYVDGYLKAEGSATANYTSSQVASVGGMSNRHTATFPFVTDSPLPAGRIDLHRIWSRPLLDGGVAVDELAGEEIAELWADGDGLSYPFSLVVLPDPEDVLLGITYSEADLPDPGQVRLGVVYG